MRLFAAIEHPLYGKGFQIVEDGIDALRHTQAWQNYGRPAIKLPENYKRVMTRWLSGEITAVTAMNLTGLKRTTFYRLANEYKRGELTV